jgi:hypothetical protein
MNRCDQSNVQNFLDFLQNAPADEDIIRMDCDEFCDEVSQLAERVANGEDLTHILPALEEHMQHWSGCREEFEALVAVLKAEQNGEADTRTEQS